MSKKQSHHVEEAEQQIEELTNQSVDWFKENAAFIGAAVVFVILGVAMVTNQNQKTEETQVAGWQAYTKAEEAWRTTKDKDDKTPPFAEIAKNHSASSAAPFALISQADVYYQRGTKEDLQKAKSILEDFLKRYKTFSRYTSLAEQKLKAINAELAFEPAWREVKKPEAPKESDKDANAKDSDKADEKAKPADKKASDAKQEKPSNPEGPAKPEDKKAEDKK